ncbi:hypothetical protein GCM10022393_38470 [Aquimarina addita]|uniref:VWFA domain-containing protein n=1 Tax=Aquimarina addita TaxID=870485 RepID=A0ABP6UW80_9FLAO
MRKVYYCIIFLLCTGVSFAQQIKVEGIVIDDTTGTPLVGVSVFVKGTTDIHQTDFDGKYAINTTLRDTLIFRYLGYETRELQIASNATLNVRMMVSQAQLEEVVVVGYAAVKKKTLTACVSKINNEDLESVSIISNQSLNGSSRKRSRRRSKKRATTVKGSVAGLSVHQATSDIKIRGVGSSSVNHQPLLIIDGFVTNMSVEEIDPKLIKNIDVLKDASKTAIYGSRGGNGVILVTTKKENFGSHKEITNESYEEIIENNFKRTQLSPLSTFSIDVDKASYSNVRRMINNGTKVPADAVKIEEMINYFNYSYKQPVDEHPFAIDTEYATTPWNENTQLVKIGLKGKEIPQEEIPASNLVFLIDVSGSMSDANKLPLLKNAFKLLVNQLREKDKVSIVVYAGAAGVVLKPTSGTFKNKINKALDKLDAGGSTAGGEGIELAYKLAQDNFIKNGNNRVILATDGDFNIGMSSDRDMKTLIQEKRKSNIFLTCLGFGMGNYKDSKLETLADKGNGNHSYIDTMQEAQRVLGKEFGGTLYTIAKDVKIQVEFNPTKVQAYRLIGYENRMLADEDFVDDTKDAGELGSGHTVTALYEVIPAGVESIYLKDSCDLKYTNKEKNTNYGDELLTVKFRYKKPQKTKSIEMVHILHTSKNQIASPDFNFAASVAWFSMKMRKSKYIQKHELSDIIALAETNRANDNQGYRAEFVRLMNSYQAL